MAHMIVSISGAVVPDPPPEEGGPVVYIGHVWSSEGPTGDGYSFTAQAEFDDLAATVNANIKAAGIAILAGHSITVGALDKKTVIGGAIGL